MRFKYYPVIDLFAGPGGLGEGFSSLRRRKKPRFKSVVSIEQDQHAHSTLLLRHFIREFPARKIPREYYNYLGGNFSLAELKSLYPKEWSVAEKSALKISLGKESHSLVRTLLSERLHNKKKWALVGGPPCQAYSLVGRSRRANDPDFEKDEKHFLYREYLKIIIDHRPPVFVMENVKGLLSAKVADQPVIEKILTDLTNPIAAISDSKNGLRYKLFSLTESGQLFEDLSPRAFLVRAEEYGVPQARHRMFILGIRSDIDVKPEILKKKNPPSVVDVIGDLSPLRSGLSKERDNFNNWSSIISSARHENWFKHAFSYRSVPGKKRLPIDRFSSFVTKPVAMKQWFTDPRQKFLSGHESRSHMRSDLHRYLFSSLYTAEFGYSPKLGEFPRKLLPKHKNVAAGKAGKMFSDRFRVQVADRVSTTVTSHISKDGNYFIHYDPAQCRSLTVREAARLQTFPDNYHFEGPRTQQYHQVGNAVPPYLASQIGEIVADVLDRMGE